MRDKNKVLKLVEFVDPFVRAIDGIAGERVSMRVRILLTSVFRNTSSIQIVPRVTAY